MTNALGTGVPGACTVGSEPILRVGGRDEGEHALYQVEGAIRLRSGGLAVLNRGSKQIFLFDAEGQFAYAAGREGEGPGDFGDPIEMALLENDSLLVWDWDLGRLSVFDASGTFISSSQLHPAVTNPTGHIAILGDSILVGHHRAHLSGPQMVPQYLEVIAYGREGVVRDTVATLPYGHAGIVVPEASMMGSPVFQSRGLFAANRHHLFLANGAEGEVRIHGRDSTALRIVRWTGTDRKVSEADVATYWNEQAAPNGPLNRALLEKRRAALPVASEFPAATALRVEPGGAFWIREFVRPRSTQQSWLGFEQDGTFRCRLTVATSDNVVEFGEDYVVSVARDEVDRESVLVRRLQKPDLTP